MEHYDGPAFYRKFAVKPNPEQLEDTTNERAQRSVKQRQERNDRLRLREERVAKREQASKQAAPAKPRETSVAKSTPVSQATTPTPKSSDDENYRPFQMTPIPKQLHWSHPTSESRRRYRRLVAELHKDDSSFLLFGSAADAAELESASATDTKAASDQTSMSMSSDASVTETSAPETAAVEPNTIEKQTDSGDVSTTVAETSTESTKIAGEPADSDSEDADSESDDMTSDSEEVDETVLDGSSTPDTNSDNQSTNDAETTANTATEDADEASEASFESDATDSEAETIASEAAPTEIFYPTAPIADAEATASTEPASQATSTAVSGVGDYLPVGTVKTTATTAASTPASDVSPVSESSTSEAPVDETVSTEEDSTETAPNTSETSQPESTASHAAIVRSTAHLVVSSAAGVPASVASNSAHPAVIPDATVATTPDKAAIKPAVQLSTNVAPTNTQATTDSAEPTSQTSDASNRPAEVNQLLDRATADDTAPASSAPRQVKPKAKPSRGLGHSLGDIMQEEGNDQRNLALFDRPEMSDTVSDTEEADQTERGYHFPGVDLLPKPVVPDEEALDEWIEHQAEVLDETLSAFHVDAHVSDWTVGPTVTQFQISLALGVKVNKITNLNDDLKLALAAKDIRIEAPIPGKSTVGIEIPNLKSRPVMLSEILNSPVFQKSESPLTVALGVDLFGQPQVTDLRKMPHGLIAGATGSGKSVFINSLLLSILYKATPAQVKLLLIDPKAVEMAPYDALPHLLSPVISDPKAAAAALKWVVTEMDQRYEKLAAAGVRNIEQFNDRADANDEPSLKMPYIVIIIDELADLMMMAASEVQDYIVRITQKARAAGIHLLVATQRPSVDIVTGTIKNNIPTRIAFMVSSQIDSRTILDTAGAENLLGRGDMLYLGNGASQPMRLQGAFVESEVDAITDFVRTQGKPHYAFEPKGLLQRETAEENQDDLLPKVLEYIAQEKTVSTSKLQRVFSIGYNRAANLIDDLEQHHYVSPQHGSKPREVYLTPDDLGKDLPEPHD
ncbi:DNA translocase FtsK [Levilactobacillus parabrevis]|uniref:DNA translocase FtsK n=1 Tax=Levilactobacillus parabrevis ATCC 53295 TaxID=1267003 RepID=A0A0R1GQJ2_9LACO|nr:DNA translocase FtsK [Levilactobacillus parabrevis]KRK36316.1 DNA segregation ATPase FtsK SpoIIIE related protein [Levilactobacillus parabrevis ATCC 53295]KRO05690.1 DNA segregation ATPase FtsK SpoIIIE related protein [Levilactobacillus parabrevis]